MKEELILFARKEFDSRFTYQLIDVQSTRSVRIEVLNSPTWPDSRVAVSLCFRALYSLVALEADDREATNEPAQKVLHETLYSD